MWGCCQRGESASSYEEVASLGPVIGGAQSALALIGRKQWSPHSVSRLTKVPAGAAMLRLDRSSTPRSSTLWRGGCLPTSGCPSAPVVPSPARRLLPYPRAPVRCRCQSRLDRTLPASVCGGPQGLKKRPLWPAYICGATEPSLSGPVSLASERGLAGPTRSSSRRILQRCQGGHTRPGPASRSDDGPTTDPICRTRLTPAFPLGRLRQEGAPGYCGTAPAPLATARVGPNGGLPVATAGRAQFAVRSCLEAEARWNRRRRRIRPQACQE